MNGEMDSIITFGRQSKRGTLLGEEVVAWQDVPWEGYLLKRKKVHKQGSGKQEAALFEILTKPARGGCTRERPDDSGWGKGPHGAYLSTQQLIEIL